MTMLLRLDTPAVRRLIEDDPEFQIELTRACTAEIVRQLVLRDAEAIIAQIEPIVVKSIRYEQDGDAYIRRALDEGLAKLVERDGGYYAGHFKPTKATQEKIDAALLPLVAKQIERITTASQPLLQEAAAKFLADIDEKIERRIENRLTRVMDEEINRRVDAKFKSLLAQAVG